MRSKSHLRPAIILVAALFASVTFWHPIGYTQNQVLDSGAYKNTADTAVSPKSDTHVGQLEGGQGNPGPVPPASVQEKPLTGAALECFNLVNNADRGGSTTPFEINYPNSNFGSPNVDDALNELCRTAGKSGLASGTAAGANKIVILNTDHGDGGPSPQGTFRKIDIMQNANADQGHGGLYIVHTLDGPNKNIVEIGLIREGSLNPVGVNDNGNTLLGSKGFFWRGQCINGRFVPQNTDLRDGSVPDKDQPKNSMNCSQCHMGRGDPDGKNLIDIENKKIRNKQEVFDLCMSLKATDPVSFEKLKVELQSGKVKFRDDNQSQESLRQELGLDGSTPPVNADPQIPNIPIPPIGGGNKQTPTPSPSPTPTPDKDKDGVPDNRDNCPEKHNAGQTDSDKDGKGDTCDDDDQDKDGIPDRSDNCPDRENPGQSDVGDDGLGDACDEKDSDGDGVSDSKDNCPGVSNALQSDADKDGRGDSCNEPDEDQDGVPDAVDRCPLLADTRQSDANSNGIGDRCDRGSDSDRDGIQDPDDNCPSVANSNQADEDGDGYGDACNSSSRASRRAMLNTLRF